MKDQLMEAIWRFVHWNLVAEREHGSYIRENIVRAEVQLSSALDAYIDGRIDERLGARTIHSSDWISQNTHPASE